VLPWGEDECVAWHTPFTAISNRPMAWAQGQWNPSTCMYDDEDLWTATMTEEEGVNVHLLDGDTGTVLESVHIPEIGFTDYFGLYGGAVDGQGNFYGSQMNGGRLVYVDKQTFEHRTWPIPIGGYGITVDSDGYVWVCERDIARFDPETQTWDVNYGVGGMGGCMADGDGKIWRSGWPTIRWSRSTRRRSRSCRRSTSPATRTASASTSTATSGA
jgi:streptogramin lyase